MKQKGLSDGHSHFEILEFCVTRFSLGLGTSERNLTRLSRRRNAIESDRISANYRDTLTTVPMCCKVESTKGGLILKN